VLIEKRAMEAFDEAVALRPANFRGPMLDPFELQEELVGMLIGSPAELPAVIRENLEPSPGVTAVAINPALQVHATDSLEHGWQLFATRRFLSSLSLEII
jgi:hypothetical protein